MKSSAVQLIPKARQPDSEPGDDGDMSEADLAEFVAEFKKALAEIQGAVADLLS